MRTLKKLLLIVMPLVLSAADTTVEQLFNVQTVKVARQTSSVSKKNYGYVKADESRIYDISPRFGGYVTKLYADTIYKRVKKGDPLVNIYSPEVFKAKEEYLNTLRYAQKRDKKTMLKSSRLKLELLGVSFTEIKAIMLNGKASANTTIYAPRDGYVFVKNIENGAAFNAKEQLFQIINLDEVWIEAKLFEEQLLTLDEVEKYTLSFKGVKEQYTTSKAYLYPDLNPKEATATLRLQVKNRDNRLLPGMYTSIVSLSQTQNYLTLPSTAVIRKNGTYYVFVVGEYEGEYEPIEISVSVLDAKTYIITEGLSEGDEVVNNALFMMDSDAQVNGLY